MSTEHAQANADHDVVPLSEYGDDIYDICAECGLAIAGDQHAEGGWAD